jgi:hypothetical protein
MFSPPTGSSAAEIVSEAASLTAAPPSIAALTAIVNDVLRRKERAGDDLAPPRSPSAKGGCK